MKLPFQSLRIQGFRSISDEGITLENISNLNFICGQNNSGKSNVLTFVLLLCNYFAKQKNYSLKPTDFHQGGQKEISFSVTPNIDFFRSSTNLAKPIKAIYEILGKFPLPEFNYSLNQNGGLAPKLAGSAKLISNHLNPEQWRIFWTEITNQHGGSLANNWIPETVAAIHPLIYLKTEADLIPALRTLSNLGRDGISVDGNTRKVLLDGRQYFGGMGTIDLLFHNQHPPVGQENLQQDFQKVQEFLRYITGNKSATIEIPSDKSALIVNIDGKRLPISSLGTGIEELVIISTAASHFHNQVVCLEEPELHIHPLLQRKLIEFLQKETDNTYFIATHSPHILDASSASVYHTQLVNNSTSVTYCDTGSDRFQICHDLGYQASDLLQANSIIWVEGPSDRVYLSAWLKHAAPELIEGLDFSIMFYGGKLLSHLSANDEIVSDFISLNHLNRNIAVVIDSDKDKSKKEINDTKKRIAVEVREIGGVVWVTQGREIENYIQDDVYSAAMEKISFVPNADFKDEFSDRCVGAQNGNQIAVNKLKLARTVVELPLNVDVLDLQTKLDEVVAFIRKANRKNI